MVRRTVQCSTTFSIEDALLDSTGDLPSTELIIVIASNRQLVSECQCSQIFSSEIFNSENGLSTNEYALQPVFCTFNRAAQVLHT
jgi:hypothetical protein